jgi:hypothetical protein
VNAPRHAGTIRSPSGKPKTQKAQKAIAPR